MSRLEGTISRATLNGWIQSLVDCACVHHEQLPHFLAQLLKTLRDSVDGAQADLPVFLSTDEASAFQQQLAAAVDRACGSGKVATLEPSVSPALVDRNPSLRPARWSRRLQSFALHLHPLSQLIGLCHVVYMAHVSGRLPLLKRGYVRPPEIEAYCEALWAQGRGRDLSSTDRADFIEQGNSLRQLLRGKLKGEPMWLDLAAPGAALLWHDLEVAVDEADKVDGRRADQVHAVLASLEGVVRLLTLLSHTTGLDTPSQS